MVCALALWNFNSYKTYHSLTLSMLNAENQSLLWPVPDSCHGILSSVRHLSFKKYDCALLADHADKANVVGTVGAGTGWHC